jgi:hypothetical protein
LNITLDSLKEILEYKQGSFYWKKKISDKIVIGKKAGSSSGKYEIIKIYKQNYYTHQLVFYYHNGYLPETVDHIDNNTKNNKIENLRAASYNENLQNTRKIKKGSSQYKGVCFDKKSNKWLSRIQVIDKRIYLGYFDNELDAAKAYDQAALTYFKEFANTNERIINENSKNR